MKIVLASVILLSLAANLCAAEKKLWAKSFIDQKAPELVVEEWISKEPDTEGKFVLIDFWATWCGPCLKAIPELNEFHKKFKDKLVVIGISDEPVEKVEELDSPKIKYFSAVDTKATTKNALGVKGIPHVIVIDPSGVIRWEGYPFLEGHELTETVLDDLISKYGSEKAVP